jgi:phosphoribosylformylglycinamidine synthase
MKFGVVVFPGSNCDHDAWYALGEVFRQPVEFLWHQSEDVKGFDAILLPGVLQRNAGMKFVCKQVHIRVEQTDTPFTTMAKPGQVLEIPIAHGDGNYFCDEATLAELERNRQIVFRYTTPDGREDAAANPNGSLASIAGICNRERNVLGLMPHPERAVEKALGSTDGLVIFQSLIESLARRTAVSA